MGFQCLKDLLANLVPLEQVEKRQDYCIVWDRSLIMSTPAKRRMVGTSFSASFKPGSLSEYHCCIR